METLKNEKVQNFKIILTKFIINTFTIESDIIESNKKEVIKINKQYKNALIYTKQVTNTLKTAYPSYWVTFWINHKKIYQRRAL